MFGFTRGQTVIGYGEAFLQKLCKDRRLEFDTGKQSQANSFSSQTLLFIRLSFFVLSQMDKVLLKFKKKTKKCVCNRSITKQVV